MKTCEKCLEEKELTHFGLLKGPGMGPLSVCSSCYSNMSKKQKNDFFSRKCLNCSEPFLSKSKINRICNKCKGKNSSDIDDAILVEL